MGNEHESHILCFAEFEQKIEYLGLNCNIERCGRLISYYKAWVGQQ